MKYFFTWLAKTVYFLAFTLLGMLFYQCSSPTEQNEQKAEAPFTPIDASRFDTLLNGQSVKLFTLQNEAGITVQITNYGGRVVALWTPDKDGNFADIVLGYDHIGGYLNSNELYYGATIGRFGNRIAEGRFSIGENSYELATNNSPNHLHGGPGGFHHVVWEAKPIEKQRLTLNYRSPDGEEGYPGNLDVEVIYELTEDNELHINYKATTDQATPINLTHHSFFNLSGSGNIGDHVMTLYADSFVAVNENLIPLGELAPVEGTPFDFRQPKPIGQDLASTHEQLQKAGGYDHCWVVRPRNRAEQTAETGAEEQGGWEIFPPGIQYLGIEHLDLAAFVHEPNSRRTLKVYTNEPGIQFYGGNFLSGRDTGKNGQTYGYREAFCLETQHFPDSPNQPNFPSTLLLPNEVYYSKCVYKFGIE